MDTWYQVSGAGTANVSGHGRDEVVTSRFGRSPADLYPGDGQYRGKPVAGTLLAGFLDELFKLRADFERRLAYIEQALMPQMLEQPAHV
ncbi:hypothetical protein [Streptomyces sp. NPDC051577]|uniref:hypothetical protein n=1 Tax=Streptomyces sp. NPDC051577 TaxID=3155166 RepID=UPI00344694AC